MTHPTDFRALCAELLAEVEALNDVIGQDGQADLTLLPRARVALAAPQQGAPSDEEISECLIAAGVDAIEGDCHGKGRTYWEGWHDHVMDGIRAVLARYGAQAVPVLVAPGNICTGCGTPRHEAIAAIANGAMACCPDCSTLTVEDRNAIRAISPAPVPVAERLPGEGDCDDEGRCWWHMAAHTTGIFRQSPTWCLGKRVPEDFGIWTHWRPWWSLPLPQEGQP